MNYIIEKFLPLKSNVDNKVNHFKKICISGNLDYDDKDNIWKWFNRFLRIAQYYIKIKIKNKIYINNKMKFLLFI